MCVTIDTLVGCGSYSGQKARGWDYTYGCNFPTDEGGAVNCYE